MINQNVKETYQVVESKALVDAIEKTLTEYYGTSEIERQFIKYYKTKHAYRFYLPFNTEILGDTVKPYIQVTNSYQKESALHFAIGLYRFVCDNGLVVGKSFFDARVIHRVGPKMNAMLTNFEYNTEQAIKGLVDTIDVIEQDMHHVLTEAEQIQLIGNLNLSKKVRKAAIDNICLSNLRPEDNTKTLWATYNIVQEQLRRRTKSNRVFEQANNTLMDDCIFLYNNI